jgi:hypothetical protein
MARDIDGPRFLAAHFHRPAYWIRPCGTLPAAWASCASSRLALVFLERKLLVLYCHIEKKEVALSISCCERYYLPIPFEIVVV